MSIPKLQIIVNNFHSQIEGKHFENLLGPLLLTNILIILIIDYIHFNVKKNEVIWYSLKFNHNPVIEKLI